MTLDRIALEEWGERIGATMPRPLFIALIGDLGAGKSVLARAIARGAGVMAPMPSPTFNLMLRYEGRDGAIITHIDLYRVRNEEEVWELGWDELGEGNEIVLVEWADRAASILPATRCEITLDHTGSAAADGDTGERTVHVECLGGALPLPRARTLRCVP